MPAPDLDATVRGLYRAATGAASWDEALAGLRDDLGASGLQVLPVPSPISAGLAAPAEPRWVHGPAPARSGHSAELRWAAQPGASGAVQITWADGCPPDDTTRAWLDRLAPHLHDALRAGARLRQLPARGQLGQLLLDTLPHPAWLLLDDGAIAGANVAARHPGATAAWLRAAGPLLALHTAADQQVFDAARRQALASGAGRPVLAPLRGVHAAAAATQAPLRARWLIRRLDAAAGGPVLLAILFDPDGGAPGATGGTGASGASGAEGLALSAPSLAGAFGFTPAESRVAVCLAQGCTVRQIGSLLGVAPSTVRTHLDQVMAKLGVGRKLDAVRLLVQGGWMWRSRQEEGDSGA